MNEEMVLLSDAIVYIDCRLKRARGPTLSIINLISDDARGETLNYRSPTVRILFPPPPSPFLESDLSKSFLSKVVGNSNSLLFLSR